LCCGRCGSCWPCGACQACGVQHDRHRPRRAPAMAGRAARGPGVRREGEQLWLLAAGDRGKAEGDSEGAGGEMITAEQLWAAVRRGESDATIAARIGRSERGVRHLRKKYGVPSATQL